MNRTFLATTAFLIFSVFSATAAMAQVEQPSQVSFQGTALITKDSTDNLTTHHATQSGGLLVGYSYQFNDWTGVEGNYGYSRNTQDFFRPLGDASIRSDIHEVTGSFVAHFPVRVAK